MRLGVLLGLLTGKVTTPVFNPATLALSGWWKTDFVSSPWTDTASAGSSGGRTMAEGTNPPSVGSALNGHNPANFDGVNDLLTSSGFDVSALLGANGFIATLFNADTTAAAATEAYDDRTLFADANGRVALAHTTSGIRATIFNGSAWVKTASIACPTGGWHWAFAWWDGTNLFCQLDGGSPVSVAQGGAASLATGAVKFGQNYTGAKLFDGRQAEVMTASADLHASIADILSYSASRYGAPPVITSLSVTSGGESGGTAITVTGTNFVNGCTCKINGVDCTSVVFVDSTSVTCVSPAGSLAAIGATVNFTLINPDMQSGTTPWFYVPDSWGTDTPRVAWYPSDAAVSGSNITSIADRSGNGRTLTGVSGHEPQYVASSANFNGLPTSDFPTGNAPRATYADLGYASGGPISIYAVCRTPNEASNRNLIRQNNDHFFIAADVINELKGSLSADGTEINQGITAAATPTVLAMTLNSGTQKLYTNSSATPKDTQASSGLTSDAGMVGTHHAAPIDAFGWHGEFAAIEIYDGLDSDATRAARMVALGVKYGIAVNSRSFLSLTAFLKNYSGSSPWVGSASLGTSASQDATGGAAPAAGTALNGHGTADFNGTTQLLVFDDTLDTYYNIGSGSGWCLFNADTAHVDTTSYLNPCFMVEYGSGNASFAIGFADAGIRGSHYDGTYDDPGPIAQATGAWCLVQWKFDGTNFKIRKNGGSWSSVASGNFSGAMTGACRMGANFTASSFFDGRIAEFAASDTVISDADFDNVLADINTTYGLSLS